MSQRNYFYWIELPRLGLNALKDKYEKSPDLKKVQVQSIRS